MEIVRITTQVVAFIRPAEGANVGLVDTPQGRILIDTSGSPLEMRALLDTAGVSPDEVRLVVNTHSHSDHTWGNQLFVCPIVAHRQCQRLMEFNLQNEWGPEALQEEVAELRRKEAKRAEELRKTVDVLQIKLPDQVFDERFSGVLGGVRYEVIHLGGHTPDLSVVCLPEKKVLFASDLIFQGRYPYIFDGDITLWIEQLGRLLEFEAEAIIPGHGVSCGPDEINYMRDYLEQTWYKTREHIKLGHNEERTAEDPAFPIFSADRYERLHRANIRYMYKQIKETAGG